MIKIEVDESYAYDMLAILGIKSKKSYGLTSTNNYISLNKTLSEGIKNHDEIMASDEYKELEKINEAIFDYIDTMKIKPSIEDGVWVDKQNYNRFLAKKAIQEKFFPDTKNTEQKIGYDK